jgi:hypothetical protein
MDHLFALELDQLKKLQEEAAAELTRLLLNGALWHEVREQKNKVTELSIVIHKKIAAANNMDPGNISQQQIQAQ